MVLIDRSYMTYYWSADVSIALPCIIFEVLTLNNIVTLKYAVMHAANFCTICTSLKSTDAGLSIAADSIYIFIHLYTASSCEKL